MGSADAIRHADTGAEKLKPENFVRVLRDFLGEFPEFKAVVVDGENGIAHQLASDRVIARRPAPGWVLRQMLRACDLFLGIDSCHIHAADLFRAFGVGLFGPTTSRRWGYKFTDHRHIQGQGSMDMISVADVSEALHSLARSVQQWKRLRASSVVASCPVT